MPSPVPVPEPEPEPERAPGAKPPPTYTRTQTAMPHTRASAPRGTRTGIAFLAGRVLYWMPVWVPLLLLWQVALRGLSPALDEHRRLEGEETAVFARHQASQRSFQYMEALARAWDDPVYRERMRRLGSRSGPAGSR